MLLHFVLDTNATFSNSCWNSGLLCTCSRQLSLIFTVLEVNFVLAAVASGLKSFFLCQYKVGWNVSLAFKINKIVWNLPQGDHQFLFWRNGFAHIGISSSKSRFKQFQQLIKFLQGSCDTLQRILYWNYTNLDTECRTRPPSRDPSSMDVPISLYYHRCTP